MSNVIPIRVVVDGSGDTTGLSEFLTGETLGLLHGGTGATTAQGARTNLGLADIAESGSWADLLNKPDTDQIPEGTSNLYFTSERVDDRVASLFVDGTGINKVYDDAGNLLTISIDFTEFDSDDIVEGAVNTFLASRTTTDIPEGTNLYYTNERVDDRVAALIQDGVGITKNYDDAGNLLDIAINFAEFDTDDIVEGSVNTFLASRTTDDISEGTTNLYYTDTRVRNAVSATGSINYDSATGVFSFTQGDSDTINEGSTNLFFTAERVDDRVAALIQDGVGITKNYDDAGNLLDIAINFAEFDSDDIVEGTVNTFLANRTTDDIAEGSTNLYYTNARADARIAAAVVDDLSDVDTTTAAPNNGDALVWDGTNFVPGVTFSQSDFDNAFNNKKASDIELGTATDGSLSDGAIVLESTDKTADAIDELNEALNNIRIGVFVRSVTFTGSPTAGGEGTTVTLSLNVDGSPNRYDIDWGDGSNTNGTTDSTPSHTYTSNSGSPYTVTVRAYNNSGSGAGSEASATNTDYIIIYTADPNAAFALYRNATGGSTLSGNNLYVIEGDSLYLQNLTTNTTMADVTYNMNWGDGTVNDTIASDSAAGGVSGTRLQHTWGANTDTGTGRDTLRLTLDSHSTANPAVIPDDVTSTLKVYDPNISAPAGLSSKSISFTGDTGTSPRLAAGFTDNSGGTSLSGGQDVDRTTKTSGTIETTTFSTYAYNADSGTLSAIVNGSVDGVVTLTAGGQQGTYTSLVIDAESDYNLLNSSGSSTSFSSSIYHPDLYKGFRAHVEKTASAVGVGVNSFKLSHSSTGDTNLVQFVKDDLTSTPTTTSGTITENVGNYRYISGIPYYTSGSSLTWSGITVDNFIGQTYRNTSSVVTISSGTNQEGTSSSAISTQNYNYSAIDGSTTFLTGGIPNANTGNGTPYALGNLNVNITGSSVRTIERLGVKTNNVNGSGSMVQNTTAIQVHTAGQSGISETSIDVSSSLGSGFNDDGVRIFDFSSETTNNPSFNGSTNFYTNNPYTESSDLGMAGTKEATLRIGKIEHNVNDYSSGYLPTGPNRSGDTGTQYFTLAFRRTVTANFNINITSASGVAGVWIAAPGTSIDNSSSINGWLNCGVQYAGAGVPGGNTGNGGNGSDGCASTGSDRIISNTSLSGNYTMTLGTENLTNATGNVALVRIALDAGQSVTTLSVS
jgi:hypothetical protein